jgi:hypothetical protein
MVVALRVILVAILCHAAGCVDTTPLPTGPMVPAGDGAPALDDGAPPDAGKVPLDDAGPKLPPEDGGGDPGGGCYPRCLTQLVEGCIPSGGCMTQTMTMPPGATICFANGVRLVSTYDQGTLTSTLVVSNQGRVCYSVESTIRGQDITSRYLGPAGALVAIAESNAGTPSVQKVTCGGMTYVVDTTSAACRTGTSDAAMCTMGTCP